ncbi:MAG: hypothetical protein BM557_11850 [Flavobacterium sp. MedPE-SWcel]|uniref:T9SS sorting signal type C domain-containing protein n=1 Tax=uncultured Flavobacterium sp. TaxID=165435 RepID=UPI000921FA5B|nr:T9SS sorting signal type C domain-containing protein [uncultured Flavobacterium sp.]OIQ15319.1 MAG: hypothetical protein BM557_11850 [Flavobacterium sp. MedPE-SWcel]
MIKNLQFFSKKILFLTVLLVLGVSSWAQVEDFTDGNFTSSPVWTGDTSLFHVITDATVPEGTAVTDGHFLAADVNQGNITLMTASDEVTEWEFSIASGDFNPSDSNYLAVILMSDVSFSGDIATAVWEGYYLELGVTGSSDKLELWRKDGAGAAVELAELSTTSYGLGALEAGVNVRITRSAAGEWQLYTSSGFTYDAEPTIAAGPAFTDNTYSTSSYFGVAQHFTSTSQATRRIYMDNVSVGGDVAVATPVASAATNISYTGFTANWGTVAGATSYTLDVSTSSDFSSFVSGYEDLDVSDVTSYAVTGLDPDTTYYYRVMAVAPASTSGESSVINLTTGIQNVWDGAVWTAGFVPSVIDEAIIEGFYDSGVEGEFTASTMLINPGGSIEISSGTTITVANGINNTQAASAILIENNGNLIQTNSNATNVGGAQVQKSTSLLYRLDYTLWSAPVTGQNLQSFSPQTLSNRFYDYDEATDFYTTIDPSTNSFGTGRGYLIRVPDDHVAFVDSGTPGEAWTGTFEGALHNGTINVSLETTSNGFNLVGNPYPSPVNIAAFYAANTGAIDGASALYFWRKTNDSGATTYATITNGAYTANAAAGGDTGSSTFTGDSSNWVINPGQGFFVEATGASLEFNNEMRVAVNNGQFFRSAQDEMVQTSRLWLNLASEGKFSQMAIVYNENMTLGLDYGWDGKALVNDGAVTLYSIAADTDLAIQARPAFDVADEVIVGFYAEESGTYTISIDHVDGLFTGDQDIYLIDHVTGQLIDIKNEDYQFVTEAGTINDRFSVVYDQAFLGIENPVLDANEVIVYQNSGNITINAGALDITTVTIYDMRGRTLYVNNNVNATETIISNLKTGQQVLLVNIATNKGTVTKKIVL